MANAISIEQVEQYVNSVIPKIENELSRNDLTPQEKRELYNLYVDILRMVAPYNFQSFNKYLELDENHADPMKAFYHQRKDHLKDVFDSLNDMEIYDTYDTILISMPPRVGKTTTGIRFLAWITGRHPENTQLGTSYSDNITTSFYIGVMEIVESQRFNEVFPDSKLVNQNAKREEIWLRVMKRYPSIMFVPIGGSMTGRAEAGNYLYCDDLVSGLEEALSITRLTSLWGFYTVNCKQRKKDKCKEIHIATRWSVHDPISKLAVLHEDDPRCKIISLSCYNEDGESAFDFNGGFSTEYYKDLENTMDKLSFDALYRQEPIEREGLLYNKDEVQYYFELPDVKFDSVVGICDSKNLGKDYVSALTGYIHGDLVYIEDVVYNNGLPDVTKELVAQMWVNHKVVQADVEMNNGGNYYAEGVDALIKSKNGKTSIRTFFSANNKNVKIITYSDYVKKHFIFRHQSTYSPNSMYGKFMKDLFAWTQVGKNPHDDAPDSTAMMAQMVQELSTSGIKIINRKELNI